MSEHEFTLTLATQDGSEFDIEAAADALFEADCDDGTLPQSCGVVRMAFIRDAESLQDAIDSAIADVAKSKVPLRVLQVERE